MSDLTPPPPFAQQAPAPPPYPAPAWPGDPDPAAIPVAALAYSLPTTGGVAPRPGLLTALGVTSIVGSLATALTCVGLIAFAAVIYIVAKGADLAIAQQARQAPPPSYLLPAGRPVVRPIAGPDGFADPQRAAVVGAIESIHPLRPPRRAQLDMILARAGKKILPATAGQNLTADAVREAVSDHGELFSGNRKAPPPEYFTTASGRLELYDERAVFYPGDGSPPVRSTAGWTPPTPLSPEQVQALVKQAQAAPGGARLNAAQLSGLTAVLTLPNQRLAQASAGLASEPRGITIHPAGASVRFSGGEIHLGAQGQILNQRPTAPVRQSQAAHGLSFMTGVAALVAGVGLSVFLLVAGIAVLGDAPGKSSAGRRFHIVWAAIQVPVALVATLSLWWMLNVFIDTVSGHPQIRSIARGSLGQMTAWAQEVYAFVLVAGAIACAHAMVVLLLLRAKRVRAFYNPVD